MVYAYGLGGSNIPKHFVTEPVDLESSGLKASKFRCYGVRVWSSHEINYSKRRIAWGTHRVKAAYRCS